MFCLSFSLFAADSLNFCAAFAICDDIKSRKIFVFGTDVTLSAVASLDGEGVVELPWKRFANQPRTNNVIDNDEIELEPA